MTLEQIHSFESYEKEREEEHKIVKMKDSFTTNETARFLEVRNKVEISIAKASSRLPKLVVNRLLDRSLLNPDIYSSIISGSDLYLPQSESDWLYLAKQMIQADEFSTAFEIHSDREFRNKTREDLLSSLRSTEKMNMARAGTLDDFLDQAVKDAVDERVGF